MAQLNMDLVGPLDVGEDALSIVITGGTERARWVVKEVVFGALEGGGFEHVDYIPDHKEQMPSENVTTLLEECRLLNPEIFTTSITVETARQAFEPDIPNEAAWTRITNPSPPDGPIRAIEIQGGLTTIRF